MPTDGLIQVHRSFMVAKKHIKSIEGNEIIIDKYKVPIGKSFRSDLEKLLTRNMH